MSWKFSVELKNKVVKHTENVCAVGMLLTNDFIDYDDLLSIIMISLYTQIFHLTANFS